MNLTIPIVQLPHAADLPLPTYTTDGAAGMDVHAAVEEPMVLEAGAVALVPTGLSVAIPRGYEMQVRSRSGLAAKNGAGCCPCCKNNALIKIARIAPVPNTAASDSRGCWDTIAAMVAVPVTPLLDDDDRPLVPPAHGHVSCPSVPAAAGPARRPGAV